MGDKYDLFGTVLLSDETGDKMDIIKNDCRGEAKSITMATLREWVQGRGIEVSWESLIDTLQTCGMAFLTSQIQAALEGLTSS